MTDRPYLRCTEIIGFLAEYLDGELSPERRFEFDRHLAVCPSCVAYLETYKETIRMAKGAELPVEDAPDDLIRAILAATAR
jgi:anti-sigma factor RsiW